MTAPPSLSMRFASRLAASPERIWAFITSVEGISAEMWPYFRMTTPQAIRSLEDIKLQPGVPMFRSYVLLGGVLPIDYSDMTLLELTPGVGFVEESPMGSMRRWRHERTIEPLSDEPGVVVLVDQLTFTPRHASRLVGAFIRRVFQPATGCCGVT